MDILLFAIVACFLIWKLRSALHKEPTFLRKNSSEPQSSNTKVKFLTNIKVINTQKKQKKHHQNEASSVFEEEKGGIGAHLHEGYSSLLAINSQLRVKAIKDIASDIYEELFACFQNNTPVFTKFFVDKSFYGLLKKRIENPRSHLLLYQINNIEIKEINAVAKSINITIEISSKQLVYKEGLDGNIVEGSKSVPISVQESLDFSILPNTPAWRLNKIF